MPMVAFPSKFKAAAHTYDTQVEARWHAQVFARLRPSFGMVHGLNKNAAFIRMPIVLKAYPKRGRSHS